MTTFSQLIDKVVDETKRLDMVQQFADYLNQTIRELHFEPERNNSVFFEENFHEELLTPTVDTGFVWEIPRPATFQGGVVARYDRQLDHRGYRRYAAGLTPGPRLEQEDYAYYRAGRALVFKGYGGVGATISLSWFEYPAALRYFTAAQRPATYDIDSGWSYLTAVTEEEKAAARAQVQNWLLERWETVLVEGLRAKVYKRLADETRQRTAYSMYTQLRNGLYTSEISTVYGNG